MCVLNVEKQRKFNLQVYDNTDWSMVESLNDTVDVSLSSFHTQMVGKVKYLTLFQHKCLISKFPSCPGYYHYYNPNGGTKVCYLLKAGHADRIFVDGWMCQVQFRSCGTDIGHMIPIVVMWLWFWV